MGLIIKAQLTTGATSGGLQVAMLCICPVASPGDTAPGNTIQGGG